MSVPVAIDALREQVARAGERCYLVTVNPEAQPHVVSVLVTVEGDTLVAGTGDRTRANVTQQPVATLLWAPVEGDEYSLIVDGAATVRDASVVIAPSTAVLHRIAGATGDGPGCLPVG